MTQTIKIDLYTKIILSVIAISLLIIAVKNLGTNAYANSENGVQKVVICDYQGYECSGMAFLGYDQIDKSPLYALQVQQTPHEAVQVQQTPHE